MPKILDEKARSLSDDEQKVLALLSESQADQKPSTLGQDQNIADNLAPQRRLLWERLRPR